MLHSASRASMQKQMRELLVILASADDYHHDRRSEYGA